MEVEHTWERLNVMGGLRLYTANVTEVHLVYQFNKRIFLRSITQFTYYRRDEGLYIDEVDPEERNLFNQVLFSYKINPKTVLFLGYSDNHEGYRTVSTDPYYHYRRIHTTQTDRTVFVKLGYAWVL
jgi:hypothetical protein